jgi:hypothetical protein
MMASSLANSLPRRTESRRLDIAGSHCGSFASFPVRFLLEHYPGIRKPVNEFGTIVSEFQISAQSLHARSSEALGTIPQRGISRFDHPRFEGVVKASSAS